ncbi:hypothetical protein QDR37_00090 [Amnibacterium sp. CER49]|uniref:hypothetical protein n=1 Tax=Amnibacterium sp. CER49 TaxID=3039161 RepID=UPI002448EAD0|nr:hypothetical protein [Amnibacterium sp. CER49]MDH2442340.1 hypothetical protein [Amnibacterium sp. CER49]
MDEHRDDGPRHGEALLVVDPADSGAVAALEALLAGAGPHLQRVLDVGTSADGVVVAVLEPLPVGLDALLAVPGWPTAGEAVTVLVPLARLVLRLHAAGVAGLGLTARAVGFDTAGSPVLVAPPGLRTGSAAGAAGFALLAADDRRALVRLASAVLRGSGVVPAVLPDDPERLEDVLFEVAEPVPVRLHPAPAAVPRAAPPARLLVPILEAVQEDGPDERAVPSWSHGIALLGRLRADSARHLRTVRRRTWVAAGASAALLVAAVALLPAREAGASAAPPVRSTVSAARAPRPSAPVRTQRAAARALPPRDAAPVDAARTLLDARAVCLAQRSLRCLRPLEAPGSPVAVLDAAAVTAGVDAVAVPSVAPRLLRTSGGAATLDVGGATVLLVQEPAGWRLRDADRPAPNGGERD